MMHSRIEYPKLEEGGDKPKSRTKTRKLGSPSPRGTGSGASGPVQPPGSPPAG
jgi:hypothetical protein